MDTSFADITPLWDLSQATTFSQLADDDFLALIQKQFPPFESQVSSLGTDFGPSVDPNDISRFSVPSLNPPSQDSSPSPPSATSSTMRNDHDLKRKASSDEDDMEEGLSSKAQHISKKNGTSSSRRKSGSDKDENRLNRRKEQNRAAQRAFRERKEKHVKDIEDKVADLEARNEAQTTENENLRDMLRRLQSENMALKQTQGSFTFQVPKNAASSSSGSPTTSTLSPPRSETLAPSISRNSPKPSLDKYTNPLDLSSLTAFDPSVLDLLDEPTATSNASDMDFGFTRDGGYLTQHFTTIASNPAYFSLASVWDSTPTPSPPAASTANSNSSAPANSQNSLGFDMIDSQSWADGNGTLDDLFGSFLNPGSSLSDIMSASPQIPSVSPVMHNNNLSNISHSPSNSTSTGSPASQASDGMFGTPRDGSSSASEAESDECPSSKATKEQCIGHMQKEGMSPFAPVPPTPSTASTMSTMPASDMPFGVVSCQGSSSFPKVAKSPDNVEVLTAWRTILGNPSYQDCDINQLCSEFSSKARCDGSKVVLEPDGVKEILGQLGAPEHQV